MERIYKNCQSCGRPMKRQEHRGANADGSASALYCNHCYHEGQFTIRNISVEDMQQRVKGKLKESGFPGFIASFFTRKLRKLQRWRHSEHPTAVE